MEPRISQLNTVYHNIEGIINPRIQHKLVQIGKTGHYPVTILSGEQLKVIVDSMILLRQVIDQLDPNNTISSVIPTNIRQIDSDIKFKPLVDDSIIPTRGSSCNICYDMFVSPSFPSLVLLPCETVNVATGVAWEPSSDHFYLRIVAPNELSLPYIDINGTIGSDYRGEIYVTVINKGDQPFTISSLDHIARAIVTPVVQ